MKPIPPELTDIIIDHLYNNKATLRSCSLVGRQWTPAAQYHLFHTISTSEYYVPQSRRFAQLLEASPHLGPYVREVDITQGHIPYGEAARHLINLHKLDISFCVVSSFEELAKPLSHFTSLTELTLCCCEFRFDVMDMAIASAPAAIHTLSIARPYFNLATFMRWAVSANMFHQVRKFNYTSDINAHDDLGYMDNLGVCILMNTCSASLVHLELGALLRLNLGGESAASMES